MKKAAAVISLLATALPAQVTNVGGGCISTPGATVTVTPTSVYSGYTTNIISRWVLTCWGMPATTPLPSCGCTLMIDNVFATDLDGGSFGLNPGGGFSWPASVNLAGMTIGTQTAWIDLQPAQTVPTPINSFGGCEEFGLAVLLDDAFYVTLM